MIHISDEVWARREFNWLAKIDDTDRASITIKFPAEVVGTSSTAIECPRCCWVGMGEVSKIALYPAYTGHDNGGVGLCYQRRTAKPIADCPSFEFKEDDPCDLRSLMQRDEDRHYTTRSELQWTYKRYVHVLPRYYIENKDDMKSEIEQFFPKTFPAVEKYPSSISIDCPFCNDLETVNDTQRIFFKVPRPRGEPIHHRYMSDLGKPAIMWEVIPREIYSWPIQK